MTVRESNGSPIVQAILWVLLFLFLAFLASIYFSYSVTGTATLPNGVIVDIAGAGDVAETGKNTTVNFGGRSFEFTESEIFVDGMKAADIDGSTKRMFLIKERGRVILKADD